MFILANLKYVRPLGSELFIDLIHILYTVLVIDKDAIIRSSLFPLGIPGLIPCDSMFLKGPL